MSEKLFGTDGIRGIANRYPMTAEVALKTGRAVAAYYKGKSLRVDNKSIVLIGKDTRRSSYMIEQALAAGVTSMGAYALLVGPMPTPGVAFLTQNMRADAGIMVSASHNTYEYNGIKIFGPDGFKLDDDIEADIERMILSSDLEESLPTGSALGRARRIDDAMGRYVVHVKSAFPTDLNLRGMRIVLDCANGAAYKVAPVIFEELGAEVMLIGVEPNGVNINKECGATHTRALRESVVKYRADLGIALDGDADRLILVDDSGAVVDGDQVMAILAIDLKESGKLLKDTLVATPMSNMGLEIALKKHGIELVRAPVGDRFIVDRMRKDGFNLGGEQSGHIIYLDNANTGDGIVAALRVLGVMKRKDKNLSDLRNVMTTYPQVLKNIVVKNKKPLEDVPAIQKSMDSITTKLGEKGRLLVRYSGTEPLCRVMIEGEDETLIHSLATELCDVIATQLKV